MSIAIFRSQPVPQYLPNAYPALPADIKQQVNLAQRPNHEPANHY